MGQLIKPTPGYSHCGESRRTHMLKSLILQGNVIPSRTLLLFFLSVHLLTSLSPLFWINAHPLHIWPKRLLAWILCLCSARASLWSLRSTLPVMLVMFLLCDTGIFQGAHKCLSQEECSPQQRTASQQKQKSSPGTKSWEPSHCLPTLSA